MKIVTIKKLEIWERHRVTKDVRRVGVHRVRGEQHDASSLAGAAPDGSEVRQGRKVSKHARVRRGAEALEQHRRAHRLAARSGG